MKGESGWGGNKTPKPARSPSLARPGTEEKIIVMLRRFERGEALFHPDDVSCFSHDDRLDPETN